MIGKNRCWRVWFAALLPLMSASQVIGQEEAQKVTQTVTVVVSSDDEKSKEALEQIRKQLGDSGLSEEAQKKILAQVEEALKRAAVVTAEATDAGKAAANRAEEAAAQWNIDGGRFNRIDVPSMQLNMDDLRNRIQTRIQGRFQVGGEGTAPSYRIGISLAQMQDEDDEEGDEEDEDENDEEEDEQGMVVEQVMDDSPASKAGIEPGDVIVSVNGKALKDVTELQEVVREAGESDKALVLMINRNGKDKKVKIKPVKTGESDVSVMEMELLPQQGVFLSGPAFQAFPKMSPLENDELKQAIAELKEEIGEIKKMMKKLLEK